MANIDFEGTDVPIKEGDTIAAALYRGGTRIFSRSVQVPPPARPVLRRRRLPELPGHRRRRGQRPRLRVQGHGRPEGDAPERVAVGRPRRARGDRPVPLGAAGRLLLQGRHQAEVRVAHDRADDPQDGGPRRGRSQRRAAPPGAGQLAPRRARGRRRRRGPVGRHRRGRRRPHGDADRRVGARRARRPGADARTGSRRCWRRSPATPPSRRRGTRPPPACSRGRC